MSLVARNAIANFAGQTALLLVGFVATRFVFRDLGADAVGILYFAFTLGAVLSGVLELGIGTTVVREVAMRHGDREYIRHLLSTAGFLHWSGYLLSLAVVWMAAPAIAARWLNLTTLDVDLASASIRVLAIGVLTALPRALYASVCRGLQRSEVYNGIEVAAAAALQLATIVIVSTGGSLLLVAASYAICLGAAVVAYVVFVGHCYGAPALVPQYHAHIVRAHRTYASQVFAISVLAMVNTQSDKLAISRMLAVGALGFYNVTYSLTSRALMFSGAISQALLPNLAALFARSDRSGLREQFLSSQRLVTVGTAALVAAILFISPWVLMLVFDSPTAAALAPVTGLLACGFFLNGCLTLPHIVALAAGQPEIVARGNFLSAVLVTPVTILLTWGAGLTGAASAWVLYHVVMYVYVVPRVCRIIDDRLLSAWLIDWMRTAGSALLLYGFAVTAVIVLVPGEAVRAGVFIGASLLYAWFARRTVREMWSRGLQVIGRTPRPASV